MKTLKYCLDCRARVSSAEESCPFCGGALGDLLPGAQNADVEPVPPEMVSAGLSRREFFEQCMDVRDKASIRAAANFLLFAVFLSVLTIGEPILQLPAICSTVVLAILSVIAFFTYSFWIAAVATVLCTADVVVGYILYGTPLLALALIGTVYAAYRFFPFSRALRAYKKAGEAEKGRGGSGGTERYKPYPVAVKILIPALFLALTVACGIFLYGKEHTEYEKYKDFSLGAWNENTYENTFAGVSFTLPSDWTRADDAALKEKNDASFPATKETEARYCYWLYGQDGAEGYLELYKQSHENYTAEDYLDVVYQNRKATYDENGVQAYVFGQNYTVDWNGQTYAVMAFYTADQQQNGYHVIMARTYYKYTVIIEMTAPTAESMQAALSAFSIEGVSVPEGQGT